MRLLERSAQLATLGERLEAVRTDGRGRFVLVAGEAGIGKTALVRAFTESLGTTRVLHGACDALITSRPLGPLADIAEAVAGELSATVDEGGAAAVVLAALVRELRRQAPTVVVLEDLHWADGGTLDVLRLLARRIEQAPALVVATFRDDELDRAHPLRVALGELGSGAADRLALPPLSAEAVARLAEPAGVDHRALHHRTAGNPFFVTEVLAGETDELPDTVRDAVLARVARLDADARALVDAVAVVPNRAELWLLEALMDGDLGALDACLASGVLRAERDGVGFRHEIARVAVAGALAPHHAARLHRRALAALAAPPHGQPDLARLAHHADEADDGAAVLEHAPAAGERAAQLGSHCEAAAQFERAVRHAGDLAPGARARLFERHSYECYLIDRITDAVQTRRLALAEHEAAGDRLRVGDTHRWLSRLAWFSGDGATAHAEAERAVAMLEPLGDGPELAMAYSNMAQLRMLSTDTAAAVEWGQRAIELAGRLGETETLVHALNNVGSALMCSGAPGGQEMLGRSLALALEAGLEEHVARAYTNIASPLVQRHDHRGALVPLAEGIAYCHEHDLDSWLIYMTGYRARAELEAGDWDAAAASAAFVLAHADSPAPTSLAALEVLGRLRARRGDPDAWGPLDRALMLAGDTRELQRLGPAAIARAEAHWLAGDLAAIDRETADVLALAVEHADVWAIASLLVWRRRAGLDDDVALDGLPAPCRLELEGDAAAAAQLWDALGSPFEAALARAHAPDEQEQRRGVEGLQALGARRAADRVASGLRERGVRDVRTGPRAATRENPGGLTGRELEVLALVADGLRNAEIGARLFLSEKTVAHHVSAILRKLGVATRSQAGAEAARLGIVER